VRSHGQDVRQVVHQHAEVKVDLFQIQPVGLDFGIIQDVVNQCQQGIGALADDLDVLALIVRKA